MAQSFVTDAGVLIIPGAYPSIKVQNGAAGLATTGIVFLVGEADGGPDFTQEADLSLNVFGPDSLAAVVSKYKTGALVDAFRAGATPANDPDIQGAPAGFVLVKTNPSTKASGNLSKIGGGTYATLFDKSFGVLGNLSYFQVLQSVAEVKPSTGAFTYIPPVGAANIDLRADGGAALAVAVTADMLPPAFQAAVDALSGVAASGGVDRVILTVSGTLAVAASGNNITLSRSVNWATAPVAGDTLVIPMGSVVAGGSNENVGAYVITAVGAANLSATKLSDAGKTGAVIGTITAPANVSAASIVAVTDAKAYSPITITLEGSSPIDGLGKTLEINELTSAADLFSRTAFILGTVTPVTWVSKASSPQLLVSAAEYAVTLNVNRQVDNVQEQLSAGGKIALKLGYKGTTASAVVGPNTLVITVTGGAGANLSLNLKQFPTLNDLATFINSQTGYSAAVGSAAQGQLSPLRLDEGTFSLGSTWGTQTMRLKADATSFFDVISNNSALVQLGNPIATAAAGLPDVNASAVYLAGGARGATTDAVYDAAIDALEALKGNFVVPLFSRDAAADIADGLTDSASSYTIANVQAYARTHVNKMSTVKRRRNRQAFLSQRDTFVAVENAAANLAAFRCSLAFQDQKVVGANGIVQAQPWMGAVLAAGMQAAGFYRAIVHKGINCSGLLQAAGDFKDSNDDNLTLALQAGLLVAKKSDDGGFIWVSDQTTYSKDNNFVYNSIQAVYVADVIAISCAQAMEKAFVGQSVADISAPLALSALEGIMSNFLRLKLIAVSDDAPKGFKNASIKISGGVMLVRVEIKLAGAIYFIPIDFLVSQVVQAAA